MKKYLITIACMCALSISAQDYAHIDRYALNAPKSATVSIDKLAAYLSGSGSPAQSDEERLRAIYAWITQNIAYADSTDGSEIWSTPADIRRQRAESVLRNRTAVCLGYANLFRALAVEAGIPCEVVSGIVKKKDGGIARLGHAWPVAKVGRQWKLFDPTWGIPSATGMRGIIDNRYFMSPPEVFVLEHLPDDPVWQLLENPVSEQRFRSSGDEALRRWVNSPPETPFHYQDTLKNWLRMDSISRTYSAAYRILHFNTGNERVLFQLGRTFYRDFYDLYLSLDSIAREHIYTLDTRIDSTRFWKSLAFMQQLQLRAAEIFQRIEGVERQEKVKELFTAAEAQALSEKLRGDLYLALLQYIFKKTDDNVTEKQLAQMADFRDEMERYYARAFPLMTVTRFENENRDILNHRTIASMQLAGKHLRFVFHRINNESWQAKNPGKLSQHIEKARDWLALADAQTRDLFIRPWYFGTLRDRQAAIRQYQITAIVYENRLATGALRAQTIALFNDEQAEIEENTFKSLLARMKAIHQSVNIGIDSIEQTKLPLDPEFKNVMRANLLNDILDMYSLEGNLRYRTAYQLYRNAGGRNFSPEQKQAILAQVGSANTALDKALGTINRIAATGQSAPAELEQQRQPVKSLKAALKQMAEAIR